VPAARFISGGDYNPVQATVSHQLYSLDLKTLKESFLRHTRARASSEHRSRATDVALISVPARIATLAAFARILRGADRLKRKEFERQRDEEHRSLSQSLLFDKSRQQPSTRLFLNVFPRFQEELDLKT
jgi:hypothetical protein